MFSVPTANTAQVVMELLREGLGCLRTDRASAMQLISRAYSVLEMTDQSAVPAIRGGLATWQVRKVCAHVDANLDRSLSIAELSELVRLCPSYFQRAFKKSLGVSPHAYVLERRVQKAQKLMLMTEDSLCAIALAAGFSDQAHLTTRFHRAVGVTPSVWRRERQSSRTEVIAKGESLWPPPAVAQHANEPTLVKAALL